MNTCTAPVLTVRPDYCFIPLIRYKNGDFKVKFQSKNNSEVNAGLELNSVSVPPGITSTAGINSSIPVNIQVSQEVLYSQCFLLPETLLNPPLSTYD